MSDKDWIGTGVKATPQQYKEIADMIEDANDTPVIAFGNGPDAASVAWHHVKKFIDKCAKKNGLPNMRDVTYSYNQETGEFFKPKKKCAGRSCR